MPSRYRVRYENVGVHKCKTDRLYNGGTIYNEMIPKTGDWSRPLLWLGAVALGGGMLAGLALAGRGKHSRWKKSQSDRL